MLFNETGLSFCFDKLYEDKERANQKGKFDLLIYQGHQKESGFEGSWYFRGFERDKKYSGDMLMVAKGN